MTQNKQVIKKEGVIIAALPNASFRVKIDNEEQPILATLSGKMRLYHIKVLPGDRVTVEMTPYDETRGRITYRMK